MADSVNRDILAKVDLIRAFESDAYTRLQGVIDSVSSGASLVAAAVVNGFGSYLPLANAYTPAQMGIDAETLPAAGNALYSDLKEIYGCKEHLLALKFAGGVTPAGAGQLTLQANLYTVNNVYIGTATIGTSSVLPWNGAVFYWGWRGGHNNGAGYGFTAGSALGLVALTKIEFKIYVDTTFTNGPWTISLFYQGAA